jgi:hypothetical protein
VLWDLHTYKILACLSTGNKQLYSVAFSHNGELIASSAYPHCYTAGLCEHVTLIRSGAEMDGSNRMGRRRSSDHAI